ncbi:MAG: Ig-like domain-containing protein, partial [Actinobacteria bacterium]|nr:Ig-like domain-containing protein [Actinomycetota bacterium]
VTGADDIIDDPTHPATDAVITGYDSNSDATWEMDPERGIVYKTSIGNRLNCGQQGIDLAVDSGWTWSMWAKITDTDGGGVLMGTRNNENTAYYNRVTRDKVENWTGDDPLEYPDFTTDGEWHHIAYVGSSSGASVYVDGVQVGSTTTTLPSGIADRPLEIGGTQFLFQGGFFRYDVAGYISDTAVWNVALSETEIQNLANGVPVIEDTTAPVVIATDPLDDAPEAPAVSLEAIFDERVETGTGDIRIVDLTDSTTTAIPVTDSQVSVSGSSLTIVPDVPLTSGHEYAIEMDAGVVRNSSAGLDFAGILDQTTWNFVVDDTPPTLDLPSLFPADGAVGVPLRPDLVIRFIETNAPVVKGAGNISIWESGTGDLLQSYAVGDPAVRLTGPLEATVALSADLPGGLAVYVTIDAGTFTDPFGNGIA